MGQFAGRLIAPIELTEAASIGLDGVQSRQTHEVYLFNLAN